MQNDYLKGMPVLIVYVKKTMSKLITLCFKKESSYIIETTTGSDRNWTM